MTPKDFLNCVRKSGLIDDGRLRDLLAAPRAGSCLHSADDLCQYLVSIEELTPWQGRMLLKGARSGFFVGKHKLLGRIGHGGMSIVYLGRHVTLDRLVAIKVLDGRRNAQNGGLIRFVRESKATASLDHPNVVRVFDYDKIESHHYLVMEYVDGPNLHELVQQVGPLPPNFAVNYLMQAAAGLAAAHDNKLIHRDVKPANLLCNTQGVVKLTDLGLTRSEEAETARLTIDDGGMLGTVDYISPEQALDSHHVTSAADIYSLGASFYYLLTGSPPFASGSVSSKLLRHQLSQPKPPSQIADAVSEELDQFCFQMMAKSATARPTALDVSTWASQWLAKQSSGSGTATMSFAPQALRDPLSFMQSPDEIPPSSVITATEIETMKLSETELSTSVGQKPSSSPSMSFAFDGQPLSSAKQGS